MVRSVNDIDWKQIIGVNIHTVGGDSLRMLGNAGIRHFYADISWGEVNREEGKYETDWAISFLKEIKAATDWPPYIGIISAPLWLYPVNIENIEKFHEDYMRYIAWLPTLAGLARNVFWFGFDKETHIPNMWPQSKFTTFDFMNLMVTRAATILHGAGFKLVGPGTTIMEIHADETKRTYAEQTLKEEWTMGKSLFDIMAVHSYGDGIQAAQQLTPFFNNTELQVPDKIWITETGQAKTRRSIFESNDYMAGEQRQLERWKAFIEGLVSSGWIDRIDRIFAYHTYYKGHTANLFRDDGMPTMALEYLVDLVKQSYKSFP